jgi:predicted PurR-regulated permease PerM
VTNGNFLWDLLIIFFMIIYFMILFRIIFDIFRRHDMSGWGKAGWLILLILLPFITILIYVIVYGSSMAKRDVDQMQHVQQQQAEYIKQVAAEGSSGSSTDQIAKAHQLLTSGAITQEEFDSIKAKALAS